MKTLMIPGAIGRAMAHGMVSSPHSDLSGLAASLTPQLVHRPCLEGEHGVTSLIKREPADAGGTEGYGGIVTEHVGDPLDKIVAEEDTGQQTTIDAADVTTTGHVKG